MKIILFEVPRDKRESYDVLKKYPSIDIEFVEDPLTAINVDNYPDKEIISTFIHSTLDEKVLSKLDKLKLIATRSTGFDHVDHGFCEKRGILVCNVPNYAGNTVAEHIFGLILTISRKLYDTLSRTRNGDFSREGLCGFDLKGKKIGIIGLGAIGRNTAQIAKGFGMDVFGYDIIKDPTLAKSIGFEYRSLTDVLKASDIISLSVPATAATEKMIGEKEFSIMKDGVILINTARGSVVDSHALIMALNQGKVAAAGLDVISEEKLFFKTTGSSINKPENEKTVRLNKILLEMPNVYMTPHNAFNTQEALERIIEITINNITSFLEGKPKNLI